MLCQGVGHLSCHGDGGIDAEVREVLNDRDESGGEGLLHGWERRIDKGGGISAARPAASTPGGWLIFRWGRVSPGVRCSAEGVEGGVHVVAVRIGIRFVSLTVGSQLSLEFCDRVIGFLKRPIVFS